MAGTRITSVQLLLVALVAAGCGPQPQPGAETIGGPEPSPTGECLPGHDFFAELDVEAPPQGDDPVEVARLALEEFESQGADVAYTALDARATDQQGTRVVALEDGKVVAVADLVRVGDGWSVESLTTCR